MWKSVRLRVRDLNGEVRRERRERLPDSVLKGESEAVEEAFALMLFPCEQKGEVEVVLAAKDEMVAAKSW